MSDHSNTANATAKDKPEGSHRAKWEIYEEFDLLERFVDARKMPALSTDKGLTSAAWHDITTVLNIKHKRTLDKAQYKAKLGRIMRDYDLFKEIKGLSGGGVCPMTNKPVLDDDVWERLIKAKPKQAGKLKEFRKKGFEHYTICMMAAGDLRATGADGQSVQGVAARLNEPIQGTIAPDADVCSKVAATDDSSTGSRLDEKEEPTTAKPPSHQRRVENVKRIRDGATKSHRNKKSRKDSDEGHVRELKSLLKTIKTYVAFKMRQEMQTDRADAESEHHADLIELLPVIDDNENTVIYEQADV